MPVGRPRSGRFSLRIPQWLHEELATEAYRRNVSLNQLCFEALVARRALIKKPPVQAALGKLDRTRTQSRKVIERELTETVTAMAKDPPDRRPPNEKYVPILEFVRKVGRPVTVAEVAAATGIKAVDAHSGLTWLKIFCWVSWLPGDRFAIASGTCALGLDSG